MKKSANHQPSVALVYDRVNTPHGGAEKVLLALHQLYPEAPLYTSLYDPERASWAKNFQVIASPLNKFKPLRNLHRWLAMLMPIVFESFNLKKYDIVISVTSAEAKGVLTQPDQLHFCYLLTPPRYLYHERQHSLESHWLLRLPISKQLATTFLKYLRWWDQAAIYRPDAIVPISQRVAKRAGEFYQGVSVNEVIYPPVDLPKQQTGQGKKDYLLIISRLVSHKHLDQAIRACAELGKQLIIVGEGPEKQRLQALTKRLQAPVKFAGRTSQEELTKLYQNCQAVLMPGEEDFGIVALEANSFGKPAIINHNSGAAELIGPEIHGLHLVSPSAANIAKTIKQLEGKKFSASKIMENPLKYTTARFLNVFDKAVQQAWQAKQKANNE